MMKMNEFMTALQTHLATQQPNYPDNAQSILEVLFDAYNESSGFDNAAIKADFEELYRLMNDICHMTRTDMPSKKVTGSSSSRSCWMPISYTRLSRV